MVSLLLHGVPAQAAGGDPQKSATETLPRPTAEQAQWQDYEIGVFYHYDMNAFKPGWDHRKYDDFPKPEIFNPTKLDTKQWMEVPKALGAKYAVLTATHGSGFMLWQSDAYPYGLKQSPWKNGKGDIVREFVEIYYGSVGNNCNLLINAAPGPDGLIPEAQLKRFREFGAEIQRRFGKSLAETTGQGNTLELKLVKPTKIDHVILMEKITEGERVREYVLEGKVGETWQKIGGGTCIGHKRIERITPVEVTAVRLNVLKSAATPLIRKLAVYNTQAR